MIDRVKVTLISGKGGDGKVAFLHEKGKAMGGPAGGNGGKGGSIYIKAQTGYNTLTAYRFGKTIKAPNGENGHEKNMYGKYAPDVILPVPVGTVVKDMEGNLLADLSHDGDSYLACEGGRGGKGNSCYANPVRKAPKFAENGAPGKKVELYFEMRLLADCGLVGLPNAGKSTFLGKVTNAHAKVANYQFTTLEPQLGVVDLGNDETFVMADLPGLIEGAHLGKGLGISFLRHIERCRVILHVVDISNDEAFDNFVKINDELKDYSLGLINRPMIVVLNKVDLLNGDMTKVDEFKKKAGDKYKIFVTSTLEGDGLKPVLREVFETLKVTPIFPLSESYLPNKEKVYTLKPEDKETVPFTVVKLEPGVYRIEGETIVNKFSMLSLRGDDSMTRILVFLEKSGVDKKLHEMNIEDGATIILKDFEFTYSA